MPPFGLTPAVPPIIIKDEGTIVTSALASLDFVGAGVSATGSPDVTVTVSGSPTMAYDEVISGTGTAFTLAHAPSPVGSLVLWKNGVGLNLTTDYTLSGANLTLIVAKTSEDELVAKQYAYV